VSKDDLSRKLLASIGLQPAHVLPDDVARLQVHGNRVVDSHLVPGLAVEVHEREDGIEAEIVVREGVRIERPVHVCFGLLPEHGLQRIVLSVEVQPGAAASVQAHCTFPNAVSVEHRMDAVIRVGEAASYRYYERHVHGPSGGVLVVPKAKVLLGPGATYRTEFELIRGSAGRIDVDYEAECQERSTLEMVARINGRGDDRIAIREVARLVGAHARAVLKSSLALRARGAGRGRHLIKPGRGAPTGGRRNKLQAANRSRRSWQRRQRKAYGTAWRRACPIGSSHSSQIP
jgi:Fe-S cluster assembly scaffold protein SufB